MIRSLIVAVLLMASVAVLPASAQPGALWQVDLSRSSTVDTPALRLRITTYEPHTLPVAANAFATEGATVDIRGVLRDGRWTEWTELPAVLAEPVTQVQVRVIGAPPDRLAVRYSTTAPRAAASTEQTYEIFATREGLVGGRTASGHVIVERDHFAALPSRRGLSLKDAGDYTVKVCARNGRCEWAPVWDVGPWNTKDDYWNPPDTRQMWADLPQGRPQAQAAKLDGYNGGLDQFGRTVRNPAGIDLADGTFWDGLQLTGNSWVRVTFTWTGSGPAGFVRAGEPLNVRNAPNTGAPIVGLAADYARIRVDCQRKAELVHGTQGSTDLWYRLAPDMWVTAAYVAEVSGAPAC